MFDWKSLVKTVAPAIATGLGGPVAGVATRYLAEAVLGKPDAEEAEIAAGLASATPELLAKVKAADQQFQVDMKKLDIDLEKIAGDDRASARDREIHVMDSTPRVLGYMVTLGFFGVLGYMLKFGLPNAGGEALLVMLGALGTGWASVLTYYYGSSAGSLMKNSILDKLSIKR